MYRRTLGSLFALVSLGSVPSPTAAQAAGKAPSDALGPAGTPTRITFAEAIQTALRQNIELRQAQNATASDQATVRQQRLQFLPNLTLSTSAAQNYGRNFSETEGRIVDAATQSLNAGLSTSLTLFDGLQNVASLRQANLALEASTQDLTRARQTAVFTVASNFLSLISATEQLRVQEENLTAEQAQEQQIQTLVSAGSRAIADLYQQQATVAAAQSAVVAARRDVAVARVDIVQTLQLDPAGDYEFVPPAIPDSAGSSRQFQLDRLLSSAIDLRADLAADAVRVAASQQGVRAASAGSWPTVSLAAGYNTSFSSANDLGFTDQLDQRRGGSIALGISIPLFDRGSTSTAAQQARIEEENAQLALQNRRQTVALEVRRAYLDYQAAQEQLAAGQAQQRAADLAVRTSQQRYRAGVGTLLELTQARATQVQAASAVVTARYAVLFQQTLMSYYTGELDPERTTLEA